MTKNTSPPSVGMPEPLRSPKKQWRRTVVLLVEAALLLVLATVLWVRFTPKGQQTWIVFFDQGNRKDERQAAEILKKRGVLVISEPPDQRVTSAANHNC